MLHVPAWLPCPLPPQTRGSQSRVRTRRRASHSRETVCVHPATTLYDRTLYTPSTPVTHDFHTIQFHGDRMRGSGCGLCVPQMQFSHNSQSFCRWPLPAAARSRWGAPSAACLACTHITPPRPLRSCMSSSGGACPARAIYWALHTCARLGEPCASGSPRQRALGASARAPHAWRPPLASSLLSPCPSAP